MFKTYHISDYDDDFAGISLKDDKCIKSQLYYVTKTCQMCLNWNYICPEWIEVVDICHFVKICH